MYVFRIHIRPGGGLADPELSFDYCLKNNLLGVGWQIQKKPDELIDWKTYEERATDEYEGKISVVTYIHRWVSRDDLVWTRDTKGQYYLGKVLSPWEYIDTPEARDADIVNVFRVDLKKVGLVEDVPGKVIACFRASRTIQEIANESAVIYTKILWNELTGKDRRDVKLNIDSVWDLLSDEQVEDLVFLYLQTKGWYVIPNSRKKDTMSYEFYLINKSTYERALVQAKTGDSPINLDDFNNNRERVFFFQPNDCFSGDIRENYRIIQRGKLEQFIRNHQKIIPANILRWYLKIQ
jgi:hypothetical protein